MPLTLNEQLKIARSLPKAKINRIISYVVAHHKKKGGAMAGKGFFGDIFNTVKSVGSSVLGPIYHTIKKPLIDQVLMPIILKKLTGGKGLKLAGRTRRTKCGKGLRP